MSLFTAELIDWLESHASATRLIVVDAARLPLLVYEHPAEGYGPRTCANADAEATWAYASDFSTEQQRLADQIAGSRLLRTPVGTPCAKAADDLTAHLRRLDARTLNVTGNSLTTLARHTLFSAAELQPKADAYLLRLIGAVHARQPLAGVRAGGQSGVEEAALRAAVTLGIPAFALLPRHFLYRDAAGVDRTATREQTLRRLMPHRRPWLPDI
jgi:hypothetical protein